MRIIYLPLYGVLLHLDDTLLSNGLDYSISIPPPSAQKPKPPPDPRAVIRTRSHGGKPPSTIMRSKSISGQCVARRSCVGHRFGGLQSAKGLGLLIDLHRRLSPLDGWEEGLKGLTRCGTPNCFYTSLHWTATQSWCGLQPITTRTGDIPRCKLQEIDVQDLTATTRSESHNLVAISNGQKTGQPRPTMAWFLNDR